MEENKPENTEKTSENKPVIQEKIIPRVIEDEMKQSYVDYAMSVIVGRALPDVRDGLKPVHRRVLYAMHKAGLVHDKPFRKSAFIVGRVMSEFHPHGDASIYDTIVRLVQDFSMRYPLIQGQGNFGCFTKDTKVALIDGRDLSFGELIGEHKEGKKNYTYTISKKGYIEITEIKNPRLTKRNQRILKIVLDNNEEIKCTLDHRFMLRDGSYKKAQYLKPGDSLMPLYLRLSTEKDKFKPALRNYLLVYQPKTENWTPVHNLTDAWNLKNSIYKANSGRIRHHIDFNKLNNNPENIKRIKWKYHWKFHAEHASELHKNEDYKRKIEEGRKKFWSDSNNRKAYSRRLSKRNKKNWMNPNYRKKMSELLKNVNKEYIINHPEKRKELSKRATKTLKKLWSDPKYKEMKFNSLKEKWKDPKYRQKQSKRMRDLSLKIWSSPKHREHISNLCKERWKDEKYKEKIISAYKNKWKNDPDFRDYFLSILSENGKKANYYKFLAVCKKTIGLYGDLNEENYEKVRISYNSRKGAGIIRFNIALDKLFCGDMEKLYAELGINIVKLNHKVKDIVFLKERQNVYDLTIEETHNFALASRVFVHNSIDGDSAAAMRYSEARLNKLAEEMLLDIDKNTVKFVPNFDNSSKEPSVLPSKVPNLLINGSSGIAVGMATNIPPHNVGEVVDGVIKQINNQNISIEELMESIKGPDFPTGGLICGRRGIINAYKTGKGKIIIRAKTITEEKDNKTNIIVSAIPYMVNKSELISQIAELVRGKKIVGIADLRDESDREGMRIVIELKKDANPTIILNQLFKHTRLQSTFGVTMLALVDNVPKVLNLKQLIQYYIEHRKEIVRKRTEFDLEKAKKRAHILEGIIIALNNIDKIIKLIKESASIEDAKSALTTNFTLTTEQVQAILDMRLQRLTSLEQEKIKKEQQELLKLIEELKSILSSEQRILNIIKNELLELKERYADERRTEITEKTVEFDIEDLIKEEEMVITITHSGYIKRQPLKTYRQQRRGGHGIIATGVKEEDFVENLFVANTHSYILFFTNKGKIYWLKVYNVPEGSRQTLGKAIVNILNLEKDEKITSFIPVKEFDDKRYLVMATKKGVVKKTNLIAYSNPRRGGIIAINLEQGDDLVNVVKTDGNQQIILATKNGLAVRFKEQDVRSTGRSSIGVRGASLKDNDEIVGMVVAQPEQTLLTITENGYGKRSRVADYRLINRGGKGVINIICSERNGKVVDVKSVTDNDELMFISQKGIIIRVPAKGIRVISRSTQGVRLMRLEEGDRVVGAAKIVKQ